MDKAVLKDLIKEEMTGVGFDVVKGIMAEKLAIAIANALVQHIKEEATVTIPSGSSAGSYKGCIS